MNFSSVFFSHVLKNAPIHFCVDLTLFCFCGPIKLMISFHILPFEENVKPFHPDIEMSLERIHLSPLPGEKLWEFLLFGAKGSSSGWSVGLFVLLSSGCWSRSFDGIIRDCLCEASRDIPNVPSVPEPPSYIVIHCHTHCLVYCL